MCYRHETDKSDNKIIGATLIGPVRIELMTQPLLGPYSRTMPRMPRTLRGSWGGGRFLMSEAPLQVLRIVRVFPLGPSLICYRHETENSDNKIIGPKLIGPVRIEPMTQPLLGPYSRTMPRMPRTLWGSSGVERFLMSEVPLQNPR